MQLYKTGVFNLITYNTAYSYIVFSKFLKAEWIVITPITEKISTGSKERYYVRNIIC